MIEKSDRGAAETRDFYDSRGWVRQQEGKLLDVELFGVKKDGPLRIAEHKLRTDRIRDAIKSLDGRVRMLECGCGGVPRSNSQTFARILRLWIFRRAV